MVLEGSVRSAVIYQGELDYISRCVLDYPETETGGDLFGFWTHSGAPVVQYVIGPGPLAQRTPASFHQDLSFLQNSGHVLRDRHGLQHIGQWHSHHRLNLPTPSGHDCQTVRNAIAKYRLPQFLLVICTIEREGTGINGYLFSEDSLRQSPKHVGWVVLENESLVRADMGRNFYTGFSEHGPSSETPLISGLAKTSFDSGNSPQTKPLQLEGVSWISSSEGKALLKVIYEGFCSSFEEVSMHIDHDERVSIRFNKTLGGIFVRTKMPFSITFPHDFPDTFPELCECDQIDGNRLRVVPFHPDSIGHALCELLNNGTERELAHHLVTGVQRVIRESGRSPLINYR